ncbi:hypothetical protein ACGFRG_00080 [Streptomyces sp. NPDC048696]
MTGGSGVRVVDSLPSDDLGAWVVYAYGTGGTDPTQITVHSVCLPIG